MNMDSLIINGQRYYPSPDQQKLIEKAKASLDPVFERIESSDDLHFDGFNNAADPYREPILEYQRRVCEIMGVGE